MVLYSIAKSTNLIPQFRQRILKDDTLVEYDKIATLTPIMVEDGKMQLVLLEYSNAFKDFSATATSLIEAVKQKNVSKYAYDMSREDIICASFLPWFSYTSMTPAKLHFKSSTYPVFNWGKMTKENKITLTMQVDHSFIDGYHIGLFYKLFEQFMEHPTTLL